MRLYNAHMKRAYSSIVVALVILLCEMIFVYAFLHDNDSEQVMEHESMQNDPAFQDQMRVYRAREQLKKRELHSTVRRFTGGFVRSVTFNLLNRDPANFLVNAMLSAFASPVVALAVSE